jgi:hypothetical protein
MKRPRLWTAQELSADVKQAAASFRAERLTATDAWETHYAAAKAKFTALFDALENLTAPGLTNERLAQVYRDGLGEALRYLAGPPVSDDDLEVLADVGSIAPTILSRDTEALRKVFEVIHHFIDPHRFPWLRAGTQPTAEQRESALMASAVLLAAQRIATERRNDGKDAQESKVKEYLRTALNFTEVPARRINTIMQGPNFNQFCAECQLGDRKADIVVRLHDTRVLAIECKVSNSEINSIKRINNDAAVKAEYWLSQFGLRQVVPSAAMAGVYKLLTLTQAQERGLALFWTHDLAKLGEFIESTR